MKALILAGGFATRLRPLSCTRPKTLFPILNKPLLQWTLERLITHEVNEAILAVNHQTEALIKEEKIPRKGLLVTYSRDPPRKPLGTAGPIKKAEKQLGHYNSFLVLNGDIFADVNYTRMLKQHEENEALATIALHRVEDPKRYGVVDLSDDNRITRFVEKPTRDAVPSNLINAGAYVLDPKIFQYIPENKPVSMEREIFPKLATEGLLYGFPSEGLWFDIGQPEDYLKINRTLLDQSKEDSKQTRSRNKAIIKDPVSLDKGVKLGRRSRIGPYAILGQNVKVGKNAQITNSIILPDTVISDSATIDGAIIGVNVFIGKNVTINNGCILGDHTKIGNNITLAENVSVCPAKEIQEDVKTPQNIC
jgi:mannose-1-phosphate guanylyltransferase